MENLEQSKLEESSNFFDKPFDQTQINAPFDQVMQNVEMKDDHTVYQKKVNDNLNYAVMSNGPILSFYLKDKNGDKLMDFKYRRVNEYLSLDHRRVSEQIREFDINGSMFLKKNEDFLKLLLEKSNNNEIKYFMIDSAQVGVINWALKNNYRFSSQPQEDSFNKVFRGGADDYVVTDQFQSDNKYKGYIIKKDDLAIAEAYLKQQLSDGRERDDIDLRNFTVRFKLIKEIKPIINDSSL